MHSTLLAALLLVAATPVTVGCSSPVARIASLTQDQVNASGAQYWQQGDTKAQCDAVLLTDGATQDQVNQFHLSFDLHHTWPPSLRSVGYYLVPGPARVGLPHFVEE